MKNRKFLKFLVVFRIFLEQYVQKKRVFKILVFLENFNVYVKSSKSSQNAQEIFLKVLEEP